MRALWLGAARLNLPEFTLFISCYIVANHYLFQCLKGRRASIGIENFQRARHSLLSGVYPRAHHGLAGRKFFKIKVLR